MAPTPPNKDLIRYDLLAQEALRGVVRKVLTDVAKFGLPGDHHFYIAFYTRYPGVRLSTRLREQYPEDMTIVLQHQFWDLTVTEHTFEVGLSFGSVPERLLVPFDAIKGFFDPSVQFGLQFEPVEPGERSAEPETPARLEPKVKPSSALRGAASEPSEAPASTSIPKIGGTKAKPKPPAADGDDGPPEPPKGGADVVRLDRFRKK